MAIMMCAKRGTREMWKYTWGGRNYFNSGIREVSLQEEAFNRKLAMAGVAQWVEHWPMN